MRLIDADALKETILSKHGHNTLTLAIANTIDSFATCPPRILTRESLLMADRDSLTSEEQERRKRCEAIPGVVVELCMKERNRILEEIREREKITDTIGEFLNGYENDQELPF